MPMSHKLLHKTKNPPPHNTDNSDNEILAQENEIPTYYILYCSLKALWHWLSTLLRLCSNFCYVNALNNWFGCYETPADFIVLNQDPREQLVSLNPQYALSTSHRSSFKQCENNKHHRTVRITQKCNSLTQHTHDKWFSIYHTLLLILRNSAAQHFLRSDLHSGMRADKRGSEERATKWVMGWCEQKTLKPANQTSP